MTPKATVSLAEYIGRRLIEAGVRHVFSVAGDYNLSLLKHLSEMKDLELISVCNELNGGYAADGYARARDGMAVLIVTYMVLRNIHPFS